MTGMEALGIAVTAVVVPYAVALIKGGTLKGNAARWTAIAISLAAGVVVALAAGIPATPAAWVMCLFAAVGAVQVAYAAFKAVGITCGWLDALSAVRKDSDAVEAVRKFDGR